MSDKQKKWAVIAGVSAAAFFVIFLMTWIFIIPPYNVPKFETIENNETGFVVPLNADTNSQMRFESAEYLADKKVAAKRVQIPRLWIQTGRMPAWGEYQDTVRLVKVNRSSVIREWTQDPAAGTSPNDDAITVQSKNGTTIRLAFTCTAYIPESDADKGDKAIHPEGAEHFLYYYKGDTLEHVMDQEVRARVQACAADFCSKHPDDELRGSQHELVEYVRTDVIAFFKKRGIDVTNLGLAGGFHYANPAIQKSIDDAIAAQQLKVAALAMQEKEKVEQGTKLLNQKIQNDTMLLAADGKAKSLAAELEGTAKAKQTAAKVDAETLKIEAEGKASATKIEADAENYKMGKLDQFRDLVLGLKTIEVEKAWRSLWQGGVPSTVIGGDGKNGGNVLPVLPLPATPAPAPKK